MLVLIYAWGAPRLVKVLGLPQFQKKGTLLCWLYLVLYPRGHPWQRSPLTLWELHLLLHEQVGPSDFPNIPGQWHLATEMEEKENHFKLVQVKYVQVSDIIIRIENEINKQSSNSNLYTLQFNILKAWIHLLSLIVGWTVALASVE